MGADADKTTRTETLLACTLVSRSPFLCAPPAPATPPAPPALGCQPRDEAKWARAIEGSYLLVNAKLLKTGELVAFARATSDQALNGTVWDVVVDPTLPDVVRCRCAVGQRWGGGPEPAHAWGGWAGGATALARGTHNPRRRLTRPGVACAARRLLVWCPPAACRVGAPVGPLPVQPLMRKNVVKYLLNELRRTVPGCSVTLFSTPDDVDFFKGLEFVADAEDVHGMALVDNPETGFTS